MVPQKYLFAAQDFGFGPTSKAGAIASYMREFSKSIYIDFIGRGIAADLAHSKAPLFDRIYDADSEKDARGIMHSGGYSGLVSVMEPKSIMVAKSCGLRAFSVDSLFWFWKWGSLLEGIGAKKLRSHFSGRDMSGLVGRLSEVTAHEAQLIGHLLADKTFIQVYPRFESRKDISFKEIGDVEIVGPIIDDRYLKPHAKQDKLMISFCGQKNPLVDSEAALNYCLFALSLLRDGVSKMTAANPGIRPIVVGHPEIMEKLRRCPEMRRGGGFEVRHLKNEEYYNMINRSVAIVGPASITTLFEGYTYGKPYIFLPEQHDGHWRNYLKIAQGGCVDPEKALEKTFPGAMLTPLFEGLINLTEKDVKKIYAVIQKINKGENLHAKGLLQKVYSSVLPNLADRSFREDLFEKQISAVGIFDKYPENGARIIARRILWEGGRIT